MTVISVPNTSATAITKAVNSAKPGDTLQYAPGHYAHPYGLWRPDVEYHGAGIGKTVLDFASIPAFISGGLWQDMTIGLTSKKKFTFAAGAHSFMLDRVRLRSPGAAGLLDLCDYSTHWKTSLAPVKASKGDFHDVTLRDVELEYPGTDLASLINMWWDCRKGGGSIFNIEFRRLQVGVKNASGNFGQGRGGWLLQPSPAEQTPGEGPRPNGVNSYSATFDWSQVDHGSGKAAKGGAGGFGFRLLDSNFVGPCSWVNLDFCDYLRAWSMCRYHLTEPRNVTQKMRDEAPAACASIGLDLTGSWFAGKVVFENGREIKGAFTKNGGATNYHVPTAVKQHDRELYGR